jgi:hypothetical protein
VGIRKIKNDVHHLLHNVLSTLTREVTVNSERLQMGMCQMPYHPGQFSVQIFGLVGEFGLNGSQ